MARKQSENRWGLKLRNSPYGEDLGHNHDVSSEQQRIQALIDARKKQILFERQTDAQTAIIQRGLSGGNEGLLANLRAEKRSLVAREKELIALRDVEKSKAKIGKIEAERRGKQLQREQMILQKRLRDAD